MNFSDEGYIIGLRKYGENSLILTLLSLTFGKVTGFVKGGYTKKNLGIYQIGNKISYNAYARVEENMPQIKGVELVKSNLVHVLGSPEKLYILSAFCELANVCLPEKAELENIKEDVFCLMENLSEDGFLLKYARFEFDLLQYLGIGLDVQKCAVTGQTEGLEFISPKTGKAVCFEVGKEYQDKLFKYPHFIFDRSIKPLKKDVIDLLKMTEFFLIKNFFEVHDLKFPNNRANLLKNLMLSEENNV